MNNVFIKQHWVGLFALLAIVVLFFITRPFGCNKPVPDTVVTKHDTTIAYVQQPVQYVKEYVPIQTGSQAPVIIPPQYVPSTDNAVLLKQYIEVTNKYLALNTYKDSVVLRDSSGKRVGVVNLDDGVSENQIKYRKPSYQLAFPLTTINNTTIITKHDQPHVKFYLGGEITGNQTNFVNGGMLGVGIQNKKDGFYSIKGGLLTIPGQPIRPQFGVGYYQKISFRKK